MEKNKRVSCCVCGTCAVLLFAGAAVPADRIAAQDPSASSAYADAATRDLVARARARRLTTDRRIESYRTTAAERLTMGLSLGIGEKLLYRRETVSRIDWRRDGPVGIEVLAAREVLPPFSGAVQLPADLAGYMPRLAFDPVDAEMLLRFDSTVVRHPLAAGSEAHYRFATGDSTVVRLPDGREVRLRELRIEPRRRDRHLISGSFWLDTETHAVVQAYFRLADVVRRRQTTRPGPPTAELDYIAIDYGLWDLRWWLPRTVAASGMLQVFGVRMPLNYQLRYDAYSVAGDTMAAVPVAGVVSEPRPCRPRGAMAITAGGGDARTDSVRARLARGEPVRRRGDEATDSTRADCDREFIVHADPEGELLEHELLPANIWSSADGILTEAELRGIAERLREMPEPPWRLSAPSFGFGPRVPGLVRYNRVEGLSVGAHAGLDLGRLDVDGELRYGTADRTFAGELAVTRNGRQLQTGLAGYHRLDVFDVSSHPFTAGSVLGALIFGRDDHDYFRASGGELKLSPARTRRQSFDVRLFAERQRPVSRSTDWSVAHAVNASHTFRENIAADAAEQVGAELRVRASRGLSPESPRWAGELALHGETGDYTFVRPSLIVRSTVPLTRRFTLGIETAGGAGFGEVPNQRQWLIGGAPTVRGYGPASLMGEAYWRARVELGIGVPMARLALFGDAGWAGDRREATHGRPIRSVGAGIGILDGFIRLDVARAVDRLPGWRVHFRFDGIL